MKTRKKIARTCACHHCHVAKFKVKVQELIVFLTAYQISAYLTLTFKIILCGFEFSEQPLMSSQFYQYKPPVEFFSYFVTFSFNKIHVMVMFLAQSLFLLF